MYPSDTDSYPNAHPKNEQTSMPLTHLITEKEDTEPLAYVAGVHQWSRREAKAPETRRERTELARNGATPPETSGRNPHYHRMTLQKKRNAATAKSKE